MSERITPSSQKETIIQSWTAEIKREYSDKIASNNQGEKKLLETEKIIIEDNEQIKRGLATCLFLVYDNESLFVEDQSFSRKGKVSKFRFYFIENGIEKEYKTTRNNSRIPLDLNKKSVLRIQPTSTDLLQSIIITLN